MTDRLQPLTLYESLASNRNEINISSRGNFLLFSRCRRPILWNLKTRHVVASLSGHGGEVNGQHFVENLSTESVEQEAIHIVSTSHDKTAIIWRVSKKNPQNYQIVHQFESPDSEVFLTSSCIQACDNFYTITTTIDGTICLWKDSCLETQVKVNYCCLTSKIYPIRTGGQTDLIFLFISGSDNRVHVFQFKKELTSGSGSQTLEHLFDLTGFTDWVKCLDILKPDGSQNEFVLATASQDSLVRVWHMKLIIDQDIAPSRFKTFTSKPLETTEQTLRLTAMLETVLSGHTGFVHGLCWVKEQPESKLLQLFSCSADKTVVLWQAELATDREQDKIQSRYEGCPVSRGIWKEAWRFGETGETNLPFIGICLAEAGSQSTLFAQSLRGAIHTWARDRSVGNSDWLPGDSITGHYDSVTDLSWSKSGAYLLSSSLDKTCRLHALCNTDNRWHELARPQVHGHEINCVAALGGFNFASGAEEKTIRTFGATQFFLKNYKHLAKHDEDTGLSVSNEETPSDLIENSNRSTILPAHAQLPALGLSNRGASSPYDIGATENDSKNSNGDSAAVPMSQDGSWNEISDLVKQLAKIDHLAELPYEEILLQSTLWWESNKIFGHCNELHALASDSSGTFLASASKANRVDLAKIFVWETEKFRRVATIEHHSLTITRLRFSPDDKYLLSVSRDRTWSLSLRTGQLRNAYKFLCGTSKSNAIHERIIWDCCWTHDSRHFLTVSRDKQAILWSVDEVFQSQPANEQVATDKTKREASAVGAGSGAAIAHVTVKVFGSSIQAVDSLPPGQELSTSAPGTFAYSFALGFETGAVELYQIVGNTSEKTFDWVCLGSFPNFHQLSIRRLAFRPSSVGGLTGQLRAKSRSDKTEALTVDSTLVLASGADDCVLKLTKFVAKN